MTTLQDLFTIRRDCFLPCGDTMRIEKQFSTEIGIFWDEEWNYGSTRSLVHFCDRNPYGYRQRIPKPDVFMFSPAQHKPTSPHPIYPDDFVFSDAADSIGMRWGRIYQRGYTNIQCTGMLPLMLKESVDIEHPKGWPHAHLLDVHITDGQDQGHTTMLIWELPSSEVLRHIRKHKLPIQYYWNRQEDQKNNLDVLGDCLNNAVPLQYYIGRKPRISNKRVASFRGVEIYEILQPTQV